MRSLPVFVAVLIVIAASWFFLLRTPTTTEQPASAQTAASDEEPLPEVVTLSTNVDEIVSLYENAGWVHRGNTGPVLYVLSFRSCPTCLAFK